MMPAASTLSRLEMRWTVEGSTLNTSAITRTPGRPGGGRPRRLPSPRAPAVRVLRPLMQEQVDEWRAAGPIGVGCFDCYIYCCWSHVPCLRIFHDFPSVLSADCVNSC